MCWDASKAETLKETVENANFEPHPSSGELEIGETGPITYKRVDAETLKVQIPLSDWSLTALYLWCTGSEEGDCWKLAELLPYDSELSRDPSWSTSVTEAIERAGVMPTTTSVPATGTNDGKLSVPGQEDDDDDYWAQYDGTPNARTPARKQSVNPGGASSSEADYYARYGDVQPAMDNYDPDEKHEEIGQSTLHGESVRHMPSNGHDYESEQQNQHRHLDSLHIPQEDEDLPVSHPIPSSPSSRTGSDTVARLESSAEKYSASEMAIKQHISTSMKSMFRLARGAGITRLEFEDMVQRELETLSLLDTNY